MVSVFLPRHRIRKIMQVMQNRTMPNNVILANAKIVCCDEVLHGSLAIRDGVIASIDPYGALPEGAIDCEGDYVAPGLVELHTDNLEHHITPRPKVDWPHRAAIIAHDRELAGCGITTVFDAVRVGSLHDDTYLRNGKYARQLVDEILQTRAQGLLNISHHIHLRAELCSETLLEELDEFGIEDRIGIVSLMDHTPGQRQFRDIDKFETLARDRNAMSRQKFEEHVRFLCQLQKKVGKTHETAAVSMAKRYGVTLASHDDTTTAHVEASARHGVTLAEFPTTLEAAYACRSANIANIMGAPNLVRGGSHAGNIATKEMVEHDLLDILSSDYVPAALLIGAVWLGHLWGDMARGLATVTSTPARHVGLDDRGMLEPGLRGDVIRFGLSANMPVFKAAWSAGTRVA